jgi:hypothetical protein
MCIFCGGACGGVVDSLLPPLVIGIPFVVSKIKSRRAKRKPTLPQPSLDEKPSSELVEGK